ncbi:MAG: hypothetical protein ACRDJH_19870 [Thermomicrobiales bacterium]
MKALTKRLNAAERAQADRPRREPDPHPFDPARMTGEEQGELNALFASLPLNANGWPDLSFLDNTEFVRAATLVYQGRELDWEAIP